MDKQINKKINSSGTLNQDFGMFSLNSNYENKTLAWDIFNIFNYTFRSSI